MTDDHLDDETLSAALDGEDVGPHLAGCGACTARLDELRRVAVLVGAPVSPPPAGAVDAAVAAALGGEVVALRPRRDLRPLLAIAAVLLTLLVSVPVLSGLGDDDGNTDQFAGGGADTSAESAAPGGPVEDLGELDADRIAQLVEGRTAALATGGGSGSEAPVADAEPKTMAAEAGSGEDEEATRDCLSTLGRPDAPVLRATGTWEGAEADVLVFVDGEDSIAYVTDRSNCRILYFARLPA